MWHEMPMLSGYGYILIFGVIRGYSGLFGVIRGYPLFFFDNINCNNNIFID
jgi:hypothetical protein